MIFVAMNTYLLRQFKIKISRWLEVTKDINQYFINFRTFFVVEDFDPNVKSQIPL